MSSDISHDLTFFFLEDIMQRFALYHENRADQNTFKIIIYQ